MAFRLAKYLTLFSLVLSSAATSDQLVLSGPTAFSLADPIMNSSDLAKFNYGRGLFHHVWDVHEHSDGSQSGLGPLYAANSCASCHIRDGRGKAPAHGESSSSYVIAVGIPAQDYGSRPDKTYGSQIQMNAVGAPPEAIVRTTYITTLEKFEDGTTIELRKPKFQISQLAYGELESDAKLSGRLPQQLIGLGYLEAVPAENLYGLADQSDSNGDGVSGRVSIIENGEIGRFGWKASTSSVLHQIAKAASRDMGISTPLFPAYAGDCTLLQPQCLAASLEQPENKATELDGNEARILALYSAKLAVPPRRNISDPNVLSGEDIFERIGCADCHVPMFDQNQPYPSAHTDLLLHDMGDGLRDETFGETALANEWRTPPLWGLGYIQEVNGNQNYLHDGRAKSLAEAIMWHGGEGTSAKEKFRSLSKNERNQLFDYLNSL